jgi:hypothetical protein
MPLSYAEEKAAAAARRAARLAPVYAELAAWEAADAERRPKNARQRRGVAPPPCSICGGKHLAKGLCCKHYCQAYHRLHPRKTRIPKPPCACGGAFYARGRCETCYFRDYNARRRAEYAHRRRRIKRQSSRPQPQRRAA